MEDLGFDNQEIRVRIRQLGTPADEAGMRNIVVLVDGRGRELLISIGACEAMSILKKLEGEGAPSPVEPHAHDLLLDVCESLNAAVEKVVIDDLWHSTYYAKLHLRTPQGPLAIDARPSDAIALALRADAPLYASEAVILAATKTQEDEDE